MKKQLSIIAATLFLLLSGCSKSSEEPAGKEETGKLLTGFEAHIIPFKFGKPDPSAKFLWESETYNEEGKVLIRKYRPNLDLDEIYNNLWSDEYTYNNGRIEERIENTSTRYRYTYHYNNNLLTEIKKFRASGLSERETFEYQNGKKSKSKLFYTIANNESLMYTDIFTYDTKGNNTIKERIYDDSDSHARTVYEFDQNNNILKETYHDLKKGTSSVQKIYAYKYDSTNRIVEFIEPYSYMFSFFKFELTYNEDGTIKSKKMSEAATINGVYEQVAEINYTYTYK